MDANLYNATYTATQRAATLARENRIVMAQRERVADAPAVDATIVAAAAVTATPRRGFSLTGLLRRTSHPGTLTRRHTVATHH